MTAPLHVLLDTNTLLHFKIPTEIDWPALTGRSSVVLVVTFALIRELERHKNFGATQRLRTKARNAVGWVEKALSATAHPPLPKSVAIKMMPREPLGDFVAMGLDRNQQDDYFIASLLEYDANDAEKTIVSNDLGVRLKAQARGFAPFQLPEDLRLPEEPDPTERERDELRRELAKHQNRMPKVALSFSNDDELVTRQVVILPRPADYPAVASLEEIIERHPLKAVPDYSPSDDESHSRPFDLSKLDQYLAPTRRQLERANEELNEFYGSYERFLSLRDAWISGACRQFRVKLWLHNSGTDPATDAYTALYLPNGVFASLEGDLPKPPKMPEAPRRLDLMEEIPRSNSKLTLPYIPNVGSQSNNGRPILHDRGIVTFDVPSLTHGLRFSFRPFYLVFLGRDEPASFGVEYSIVCNETIQKTRGRLDFIVDYKAPPKK